MSLAQHEGPYGHLIGDQEVFDGKVQERQNPANSQETVATSYQGTPDTARRAMDAAQEVFGRLSENTTRRDRAEAVFRAAAILDTPEWRDRLAQVMVAEIGKSAAGAKGEVEKTVRTLRHMAGLGTHTPDRVIHGDQRGVHMYEMSVPVGPAGAVTAFNFPAFLQALKTAPAFIAGCPVVVKPSPAAPMTSHLAAELFRRAIMETPALSKAGIGPEAIGLVRGGPEVVRALTEDTRLQALSFTGSTEVGTELYRLAAMRTPPLDPKI